MLIWLSAIVLLGILVGVVYQKLGTRTDLRMHPPLGKLIDLGTHRLHILEAGSAGPTVVLEAGLMSTVLSWSALQDELARTFRVVSYDKAGLGWSDQGPMPRTADRIVDELHSLLQRASSSRDTRNRRRESFWWTRLCRSNGIRLQSMTGGLRKLAPRCAVVPRFSLASA